MQSPNASLIWSIFCRTVIDFGKKVILPFGCLFDLMRGERNKLIYISTTSSKIECGGNIVNINQRVLQDKSRLALFSSLLFYIFHCLAIRLTKRPHYRYTVSVAPQYPVPSY